MWHLGKMLASLPLAQRHHRTREGDIASAGEEEGYRSWRCLARNGMVANKVP